MRIFNDAIFLMALTITGLVIWIPAAEAEPLVSPAVYKAIQNAEKQLDKSAYAKALQKLKAALTETESGSYNQAVLWKTIGAVYSAQGRYQAAAEALEKSLSGDVLSQQRMNIQYNLGQVYLALEQYQKALTILKPWIAQKQSFSTNDNLLLAQLYSQLHKYDKALVYAKRLLSLKDPAENHYQLVVALDLELKKYADAARLLQQLVQRFPENKSYWQQLVASYEYSGDYHKATAVKDLAYRMHVLDESNDIMQLIQLYNYTGSPYLAAQLFEKEMEKGSLSQSSSHFIQLSDTWLQAREYLKAAKMLSKAAKQIGTGEIYHRLGGLYFELQDWNNAYQAYKTAVQKKGLKKPGKAWLLYGISAHEAGIDSEAKQAFQTAMRYESSRNRARQWLNILEKSGF